MRGLFLILLTACAMSGCDEETVEASKDTVRPVRALQITDSSDLHDRYFVGTAKAAKEVSLAFRVPGTVLELSVSVGDSVSADAPVARLDAAPYRTEVDRLSAELESAVASYENAKLQTDRQRILVERDVAAEAMLDRFIAAETSTAAMIKSVQGALDKATLDLGYTELTAPFEGTVVATYVQDFEEVAAQSAVLRILGSEQIEMVIDIPERFISLISYVEDLSVTFDAIGNVDIPAEISEIGVEASATTRTFPVTLLLDQPQEGRILPGMSGRARGNVTEGFEPFGDILVPSHAVFVPEGQSAPHVWVVDPESMTVSPRLVTLGTPRTQGVTVQEGLEIGELVVTAGVNSLRDGQKVSLLEEADT